MVSAPEAYEATMSVSFVLCTSQKLKIIKICIKAMGKNFANSVLCMGNRRSRSLDEKFGCVIANNLLCEPIFVVSCFADFEQEKI